MLACGGLFIEDKLDQLFKDVAMGERDLNDNESSSRVWLFVGFGSPTAKLLGGVRLGLAEGSNLERQPDGRPCQGPSLISLPKCEIL